MYHHISEEDVYTQVRHSRLELEHTYCFRMFNNDNVFDLLFFSTSASERRKKSNWCSVVDYPCTQSQSSSPPSPSRSNPQFGKVDRSSTDFYQQPSVAALGTSAALGGAAAVAAVTAAAIPLIHHTRMTNNKISPSRLKDLSRAMSTNSIGSNRMDGESILTNGRGE